MRKELIVVSTLLVSQLPITDIKMQSRHLALIILSFSAIIAVAYSRNPYCGPNEKLDDCPSHCGDTCATMNGRYNCPIALCGTPGCVCDSGYVRETDENSPCILKSQCPPSTTSS